MKVIKEKLIPKLILDIITVTKDDFEGVSATILSTRKMRACTGVRQLIVDGSTETVQRKIQEMLIGEENIEYFRQDPVGIANAFNLGISASNSEWLWFLNGRDELHPDLDEHLLMQILNASQAEVLICNMVFMKSGIRHRHPPLWDLWPPLYWVPHQATILKRVLFDRYGVFNTQFKIAMDSELWIRFFSKDISVDMLSIPICLYDQTGVSNTEVVKVVQEVNKYLFSNYILLLKLWLKQGFYLFKALMPNFRR